MCAYIFCELALQLLQCLLPVAVVALERFGTSVFAVVPRQFVASCKTPFTAFPGAFVRLLTCMHKHTSFNPCFTIHTHTPVHRWCTSGAKQPLCHCEHRQQFHYEHHSLVSLNHTSPPSNQIACFLSLSIDVCSANLLDYQ